MTPHLGETHAAVSLSRACASSKLPCIRTQCSASLHPIRSNASAIVGEHAPYIEGLTVKQEISAIREALHKDDREFMSQYGGINQAAERYRELLTLPEAAALPKGISIDDYSTYRATRFSEPV